MGRMIGGGDRASCCESANSSRGVATFSRGSGSTPVRASRGVPRVMVSGSMKAGKISGSISMVCENSGTTSPLGSAGTRS